MPSNNILWPGFIFITSPGTIDHICSILSIISIKSGFICLILVSLINLSSLFFCLLFINELASFNAKLFLSGIPSLLFSCDILLSLSNSYILLFNK